MIGNLIRGTGIVIPGVTYQAVPPWQIQERLNYFLAETSPGSVVYSCVWSAWLATLGIDVTRDTRKREDILTGRSTGGLRY